MKRVKAILQKIKNPSVLLSMLSQIIAVLLLLEVDVNISLVTGLVTAVCSILSLLGLWRFPFSKQKGTDSPTDLPLPCDNCGSNTPHTLINGYMTCSKCGRIHSDDRQPPDKK